MNKSILHGAITAAMTISIAACSSGGGDVAGIGGSGITSSGTITGFGSIFVNGVEFETPQNVSIDDNPSTDDLLALGMRVTVNGTINADGVTGTATSVSYDDDLDGPVSNLTSVGNDGFLQTLTVLGRLVRISSTSTNFDVSSSLPPGTPFDFDSIANDNHIEVSGYPDSNGVIIATRVELKALVFDTASIVEIKGTITGLNGAGTKFNLVNVTGVNFDTSGSTIIEDLPNNQLADGAFVEVKGTCNASCTTITATRIEGESFGFDDNDDVELEGVITRYASDSDFDVNGFPVNAFSAVRTPATLTIAIDKEVEVEGTVNDGVLVASKIKDEGGEIKIAATVAVGSVNATAGSFDLEPVPGQTITVKIDTSTQIEDDIGTINNSATLFTNLSGGDYVVIEGYDDGTGTDTVIANEVERKSPDDVIVQGIMESFDADDQVTVLGVQFKVQLPETEFELANDAPTDQAGFDAVAKEGVTMIKIKDKDNSGTNGVADEVEIEN